MMAQYPDLTFLTHTKFYAFIAKCTIITNFFAMPSNYNNTPILSLSVISKLTNGIRQFACTIPQGSSSHKPYV